METRKPVSFWKKQVSPVIQSKVEEFQHMGYSKAESEDVWQCMKKKVWKGDPAKNLHEVVQDILHLNTSIYISYLTVQAHQEDDLMASIAALQPDNGKDSRKE
ncbi:post-transcriptional regulator [Thalassobacillus pellis]|uniref:post-transcriptional regulator n=1 Tax=Thalassobacillus pellis TaxID=748008 RepID=UPI00195F373A|nr:post-transcriptional regulator [Thalassobacillus pellis]MBM7554648.1 hypothetical protein [Thalassobacillus pellis]